MSFAFWCLLFGALYSYAIYPLILLMFTNRSNSAGDDADYMPTVALIVTAHNEQKRIRSKLENSLQIEYPRELLDIIVASDASTDDTEKIVAEFSQSGVRVARAEERLGKEHAQLVAIQSTDSAIIVFSDVATIVESDVVKKIVDTFRDESIGAISSIDRFVSSEGVVGEGLYVRYEMWLRSIESNCAGLVGLSGSLFAARREICEEWDISSPSDFNTAMNSARLGYKAVSVPDVVGIYHDIKDSSKEFQRKVRTAVRGMTAVARHSEVLNPFKFGFFAFQVLSHKVMRWLVPWFLIGLFVASVSLAGRHWIYDAMLAGQVLLIAIALVGWLLPPARQMSLVRVTFYFYQVNLALAVAAVLFVSGKRYSVWSPSSR